MPWSRCWAWVYLKVHGVGEIAAIYIPYCTGLLSVRMNLKQGSGFGDLNLAEGWKL